MPERNTVGCNQTMVERLYCGLQAGRGQGNRRTCQLVSLEIPETTSLIPGGLRARVGALEFHEHVSRYFPFNNLRIPMSIIVGVTTRTGLLGEFNNNAVKLKFLFSEP
jgi:hypothetical protein